MNGVNDIKARDIIGLGDKRYSEIDFVKRLRVAHDFLVMQAEAAEEAKKLKKVKGKKSESDEDAGEIKATVVKAEKRIADLMDALGLLNKPAKQVLFEKFL